MIPDNYDVNRSRTTNSIEVICRNCGRKRRAVWVVARLLPRNEQDQPFTEVCHSCLNEERSGRGAIRVQVG
jgi:hypothetical protein